MKTVSRIALFFAGIFLLGNASALSVTATPAPGKYRDTTEVRLTADEPDARIFYGFDPNGGPDTLNTYSGSIILTGSTSVVWYAFSPTTQKETPITIEKYEIDYGDSLAFIGGRAENGKIFGIGIKNVSGSSKNLSGWTVRSGTGSLPLVPENLIPEKPLSVSGTLAFSEKPLELVAPDGSVRAVISEKALPSSVAYFSQKNAFAASVADVGAGALAGLSVFLLLIVTTAILAKRTEIGRKTAEKVSRFFAERFVRLKKKAK